MRDVRTVRFLPCTLKLYPYFFFGMSATLPVAGQVAPNGSRGRGQVPSFILGRIWGLAAFILGRFAGPLKDLPKVHLVGFRTGKVS